MSFDSLGLSAELLSAIAEQGYETPSPVQQQAIPAICDGRDVMAAAQTGTGKTAGFTLPILQRLAAQERADVKRPTALILTPTRELAAQIGDSVAAYGKHLPVTHAGVFGGHISFGHRDRFWDFRSIGRGKIDFEEIIRMLNRIGYNGPLSIEWEDSGMDREEGAEEACDFIKAVDFTPAHGAFDAAFDKSNQ